MKPAYEIVRADELRVGDVVLSSDHTKDVEWSSDAAGYVKAWPHHCHTPKLRRLPPERNPDVLERVLEIAAKQLLDATHVMMERYIPKPSADDIKHYIKSCIDKAISELESEAGDGGVS